MQQVKPGIFYEDSFLGVTIGVLVYSHGTIYIDAPLRPEDSRSLRSALLNQRGGTNRLLISLDSHIDRTLGARALDCTILAHQKAAQVFRNRPTVFKGQSLESGSEWESYVESIGTRWAAPDITFSHHLSLHWGGPEILVEHHPGPAPGASWVVIPSEEVVFVGDTVLINQPPFLANADLEPWIETLGVLLTTYRNYHIISGRGGPASYETIHNQQKVLKRLAKSLNTLAKKNSAPEATEKLIPNVLAGIKMPASRREQFSNRLRTGLYQYYLRHFRPASPFEETPAQEEEN
jgi:glyoxylase-like metal-dependent hydrolase (beta-lactamase superfamily II)